MYPVRLRDVIAKVRKEQGGDDEAVFRSALEQWIPQGIIYQSSVRKTLREIRREDEVEAIIRSLKITGTPEVVYPYEEGTLVTARVEKVDEARLSASEITEQVTVSKRLLRDFPDEAERRIRDALISKINIKEDQLLYTALKAAAEAHKSGTSTIGGSSIVRNNVSPSNLKEALAHLTSELPVLEGNDYLLYKAEITHIHTLYAAYIKLWNSTDSLIFPQDVQRELLETGTLPQLWDTTLLVFNVPKNDTDQLYRYVFVTANPEQLGFVWVKEDVNIEIESIPGKRSYIITAYETLKIVITNKRAVTWCKISS